MKYSTPTFLLCLAAVGFLLSPIPNALGYTFLFSPILNATAPPFLGTTNATHCCMLCCTLLEPRETEKNQKYIEESQKTTAAPRTPTAPPPRSAAHPLLPLRTPAPPASVRPLLLALRPLPHPGHASQAAEKARSHLPLVCRVTQKKMQ